MNELASKEIMKTANKQVMEFLLLGALLLGSAKVSAQSGNITIQGSSLIESHIFCVVHDEIQTGILQCPELEQVLHIQSMQYTPASYNCVDHATDSEVPYNVTADDSIFLDCEGAQSRCQFLLHLYQFDDANASVINITFQCINDAVIDTICPEEKRYHFNLTTPVYLANPEFYTQNISYDRPHYCRCKAWSQPGSSMVTDINYLNLDCERKQEYLKFNHAEKLCGNVGVKTLNFSPNEELVIDYWSNYSTVERRRSWFSLHSGPGNTFNVYCTRLDINGTSYEDSNDVTDALTAASPLTDVIETTPSETPNITRSSTTNQSAATTVTSASEDSVVPVVGTSSLDTYMVEATQANIVELMCLVDSQALHIDSIVLTGKEDDFNNESKCIYSLMTSELEKTRCESQLGQCQFEYPSVDYYIGPLCTWNSLNITFQCIDSMDVVQMCSMNESSVNGSSYVNIPDVTGNNQSVCRCTVRPGDSSKIYIQLLQLNMATTTNCQQEYLMFNNATKVCGSENENSTLTFGTGEVVDIEYHRNLTLDKEDSNRGWFRVTSDSGSMLEIVCMSENLANSEKLEMSGSSPTPVTMAASVTTAFEMTTDNITNTTEVIPLSMTTKQIATTDTNGATVNTTTTATPTVTTTDTNTTTVNSITTVIPTVTTTDTNETTASYTTTVTPTFTTTDTNDTTVNTTTTATPTVTTTDTNTTTVNTTTTVAPTVTTTDTNETTVNSITTVIPTVTTTDTNTTTLNSITTVIPTVTTTDTNETTVSYTTTVTPTVTTTDTNDTTVNSITTVIPTVITTDINETTVSYTTTVTPTVTTTDTNETTMNSITTVVPTVTTTDTNDTTVNSTMTTSSPTSTITTTTPPTNMSSVAASSTTSASTMPTSTPATNTTTTPTGNSSITTTPQITTIAPHITTPQITTAPQITTTTPHTTTATTPHTTTVPQLTTTTPQITTTTPQITTTTPRTTTATTPHTTTVPQLTTTTVPQLTTTTPQLTTTTPQLTTTTPQLTTTTPQLTTTTPQLTTTTPHTTDITSVTRNESGSTQAPVSYSATKTVAPTTGTGSVGVVSRKSKSKTVGIAVGVTVAVAILIAVAAVVFFLLKRRRGSSSFVPLTNELFSYEQPDGPDDIFQDVPMSDSPT